MKFNFKRFLAFVLALVMVFGYVPAGAFAIETEGVIDTAIVVKTLSELNNALKTGGEVVLGGDIGLTEPLVIGENQDVTLDLNGNAISIEVPEGEIDYEEFTAMSPTQQRVYMESFESLDAFFEWYNAAKEVYEQAHPPIDVGDGVIDMEDIIG